MALSCPSMSRSQINFRVTPEFLSELEERARVDRRTVTDWVRVTLEDALGKPAARPKLSKTAAKNGRVANNRQATARQR